MKNIKKIWELLSSHHRYMTIFIMIAILISAVLETFSIGLIIPLVELISKPETVSNYYLIRKFSEFFSLTDNKQTLIYLFYMFIIVYICKTIYFLCLMFFKQKFIANVMFKLSTRLLKLYLNQPWPFHLKKNSAELQNNIINQTGYICTGLIASLLNLSTELLTAIAIILLLFYKDPTITFLAISLITVTSALFFYLIKGKLETYGSIHEKFYGKMIKSVNEAFGGIKETKVLGREDYHVKIFGKHYLEYAKSWIYPGLLNETQRSILETVFIGGIVTISLYILKFESGGSDLLPILALFAVAAFRLMPSMKRITLAISIIKFSTPILSTIHNDITYNKNILSKDNKQSTPNGKILKKSLILEDVSFRYEGTQKYILDSISLTIPKGKSAGFIGPSGAGKTTIIDLILGLLNPESGKILVDGNDIHKNLNLWQQQIGYIPQNIFLSDNSIRRNIAFGLDDDLIDENKLQSAITNAQLDEVINSLPNGLNTRIGQDGLKISGGQRQRLGIARALYNNPEVLVLDEATSSLDTETEKEITNSINRLSGDKTLLIIAHRLSTLEKCDMQFYIKNGKIEKTTIRETLN